MKIALGEGISPDAPRNSQREYYRNEAQQRGPCFACFTYGHVIAQCPYKTNAYVPQQITVTNMNKILQAFFAKRRGQGQADLGYQKKTKELMAKLLAELKSATKDADVSWDVGHNFQDNLN